MLDLWLMQSESGFSLSWVDLGVFSWLDQLLLADLERDLGVLGEIDLPALTFLDLSNNALWSVWFLDQWSLPKLETLDLSSNELDHININVAQLPVLYTLDLSSNRFDSLIHIQPFASQIEYLHMADNELFTIGDDLPAFDYLLHLGLDRNKLSSLSWLTPERFPSLRYLFVADNQLESLHPLWDSDWGFYFVQAQRNAYSGYISLDALDTGLWKLWLYLWEGNNLCGVRDETVLSDVILSDDRPDNITLTLCTEGMICGRDAYCASGLECRWWVCLPPLPAMGAIDAMIDDAPVSAEPDPIPVVVQEETPVVVNRPPPIPTRPVYLRPTLLPEPTPAEEAPLEQDSWLWSWDTDQIAASSKDSLVWSWQDILPPREEPIAQVEAVVVVPDESVDIVAPLWWEMRTAAPWSAVIDPVIEDNWLTPVRDIYRGRIKSMSPWSRWEILFGTDVVEETVVAEAPSLQATTTLWSWGGHVWWSPSYAWTTGVLTPLTIGDALILLSVWHDSWFPTQQWYVTGRELTVTQWSCVSYDSLYESFGTHSEDVYRCLWGMRRFLLSIDFYDFSHLVKQFALLKV